MSEREAYEKHQRHHYQPPQTDGFWFFLLSLPASLPLLRGGYLLSHDGLFHLYRLAGLDRALHQGAIYPRWFPDFAYGYGQPVLNYYSPLAYYVGEILHLLGAGYNSPRNHSLAYIA